MKKLYKLKNWYSLEDAAGRLTITLAEPVSINDMLQLAADAKVRDGVEHFHFKKIEHTRSPIVSQFDLLLERGIITLDHLIKRQSNGRVAEKGPLFKIRPDKLDMLFPPSQTYNLLG